MKKTIYIIAILFSLFSVVLTSCSKDDDSADEITYKRYLVKSGIINYDITISGTVPGGTVNGSGTEVLYFKNWGNLELKEENSLTTIKVKIPGGGEQVDKQIVHNIDKLVDLYSYSVDFKEGKIYKRKDLALEAIRNSPNYDPKKAAEAIMLQNGGKKLDNEMYMDYDCEVWEFLGSKLWGYKGVTLKIETNLAGQSIVMEANSIEFDIPVDDKHFKLPDYSIEEI